MTPPLQLKIRGLSHELYRRFELLPASQTPSLGVMMKPEVANGYETDVQSGVQA
jgi:hypothetical protein